ncbi:MAG: ATP-binding protein [Deltaproteobacteria bacterium]|jgi:hypothetical protein|nr:ATP-binding protein [Deltaproteobacteria bacterium]
MMMVKPGKATADDIMVIEAFRLGIVPYNAIEAWTQGRSRELASIREWLNDLGQGTLIIEGPYGSGKTHFLHHLYATAIRSRYAVSLTGLDPSESTAAFPKRIYRRIVKNLKVPIGDEQVGFRALMRIIAENIDSNPVADHPYFGDLINELRNGDLQENTWAWIEGREAVKGKYGTLWDFTTVANIYCHILSCIGWLIVKVLDLDGFLILFDEVETTKSMSYQYQFVRGLNFFRGLSMVANDEPVLLEEKVIKDVVRKGKETGLVYSGHFPIPYLYRIPSYLKVVFAITPAVLTSEFRKWRSTVPLLELDSLGVDDLRRLFDTFVKHYQKVYGIHIDPSDRRHYFRILLQRCGYTSTRIFIKSMVELLDFIRFYPQTNTEAILGE